MLPNSPVVRPFWPVVFFTAIALGWFAATAHAGTLQMPTIFGDSMVLQRGQPIHVWGWATPSTPVTVRIGDASVGGAAGDDGRFDVKLPAMRSGAGPLTGSVTAGEETIAWNDILIGEVWVCSGQSNMKWMVSNSNDADLELLSAENDQLRLITVPNRASRELERNFEGRWESASADTVAEFSAVGYFFGRRLQEVLDVPVGLINNAWGGSAAEAWIDQPTLAADPRFTPLVDQWEGRMENYDYDAVLADWEKRDQAWRERGDEGGRPRRPNNEADGNHRPGNLYNGVLSPVIGYTISGVIWYQGESNSGRAYEYRDLFPKMITTWRQRWGQDEFPFYYVQLADYLAEATGPEESSWAELREAQTMTMDKLDNVGEAVILNLGEATDIHPRNKLEVANRLVRWALANQYDHDIAHKSPRYQSMATRDGKAVLKFKDVGGGLDTFDVTDPLGFVIAGEDRQFVPATAEITGEDTIVVSAESVTDPVAVRYGWANNPVVNVQSREGLSLTPFRTDDWPGVTQNK